MLPSFHRHLTVESTAAPRRQIDPHQTMDRTRASYTAAVDARCFLVAYFQLLIAAVAAVGCHDKSEGEDSLRPETTQPAGGKSLLGLRLRGQRRGKANLCILTPFQDKPHARFDSDIVGADSVGASFRRCGRGPAVRGCASGLVSAHLLFALVCFASAEMVVGAAPFPGHNAPT